jgi:hypothetical protein
VVLGNFVHANSGAGVLIRNPSVPRLVGNRISENGTRPEFRAGSEQEMRANNIVEITKTGKGARAQ